MAQQEALVIAIEKSHMGEHELEKDFGPRLWWQLGYLERGRGVYTSLPALSVRYATERLHSIGFDSHRQAACTHLFLFIHEPASRAFVLGMEGGFRFGSSFSACLHNQSCRFRVSRSILLLLPVSSLLLKLDIPITHLRRGPDRPDYTL